MNKIVIASAIAAIALAACGKEEVKVAPAVPAMPKIEVPAAVTGAVDATKAAAAEGE